MDGSLRFQNGTLETGRGKHRKYLPYAFTEQGVAMLSSVLRSETAVKVSIHIMDAFVAMRRFITLNAQVFQRLDSLEIKQLETDKKMEKVLKEIESRIFNQSREYSTTVRYSTLTSSSRISSKQQRNR